MIYNVNSALDRDYWKAVNEDELAKALKKPNTGVAKNLVMALGDGMGVTTTTGKQGNFDLSSTHKMLICLCICD